MARKTIIRIGLIGTGKHGSRYAQHVVRDLADCFQLTAISRRSEVGRLQAADWACGYFSEWRELVASPEVDAVIAVTTPNLNPAIAERCAEFGKPLLLEKPLATDYQTGRKMVDLFAKKRVPFTVGQTLRYNNVILGLRSQLVGYGRLYSFSACQRLEPSTLGWLEDPSVAGAGVIFHTAIHMFDAIRFITGREIKRIRATSKMVLNPALEDVMVAEVMLEGDVSGVLDASKVSPSRAGRYEFICERGSLQGDQIHSTLQGIKNMQITDLVKGEPIPTIVPLLRDWHTFLSGKGENPVPAEEGLAAVKICHGCRLAAATGLWVELADLDRLPVL